MSREKATPPADERLREFVASMAAADNPGSGKHSVGMRKVDGWVLGYDPTIGGSEVQAVIGVDGLIHARRSPRALRVQKLTGSEWVLRDTHDADPIAGATAFADRLSHILAFNGVGRDGPGEDSTG